MAKKKQLSMTFDPHHIVLLIALFVVGFALGGFYVSNHKQSQEATQMQKDTVISQQAEYTLEEVALHNAKDDCWQAIDGVVYDFTPYISSGEHPGGGAMIKDCGTDASQTYATKPPHSDYARSLLSDYEIGFLK
ncbi:cytochrome b5 domain-containing protein [Candidatus Woesebacteria bacterium]|nr:cytochrome b5 domain-containing protein [Candidatus Woesebacteria bacterium]